MSCGDPESRGPTSSVRPRTQSTAFVPANALSRSSTAVLRTSGESAGPSAPIKKRADIPTSRVAIPLSLRERVGVRALISPTHFHLSETSALLTPSPWPSPMGRGDKPRDRAAILTAPVSRGRPAIEFTPQWQRRNRTSTSSRTSSRTSGTTPRTSWSCCRRYRTNPASVDEEWRAFFRERLGEPERAAARPSSREGRPVPPPPRPHRPRPRPSGSRVHFAREKRRSRSAARRCASPRTWRRASRVPTATSQRQIPVKLLEENRRVINDYRSSHDQSKISFTHLIAWAISRRSRPSRS